MNCTEHNNNRHNRNRNNYCARDSGLTYSCAPNLHGSITWFLFNHLATLALCLLLLLLDHQPALIWKSQIALFHMHHRFSGITSPASWDSVAFTFTSCHTRQFIIINITTLIFSHSFTTGISFWAQHLHVLQILPTSKSNSFSPVGLISWTLQLFYWFF